MKSKGDSREIHVLCFYSIMKDDSDHLGSSFCVQLVANCILAVCKAGVIDSLSMAFSLQSEGRRAKGKNKLDDRVMFGTNKDEGKRQTIKRINDYIFYVFYGKIVL